MREIPSRDEDIDIIYAVTSYGTKARAWKYSGDDDSVYLQPFWGEGTLSDRSGYVDLLSTDAVKLTDVFQHMKRFSPTKIRGLEYGETS